MYRDILEEFLYTLSLSPEFLFPSASAYPLARNERMLDRRLPWTDRYRQWTVLDFLSINLQMQLVRSGDGHIETTGPICTPLA